MIKVIDCPRCGTAPELREKFGKGARNFGVPIMMYICPKCFHSGGHFRSRLSEALDDWNGTGMVSLTERYTSDAYVNKRISFVPTPY
jgi:hypothetical protein